MSEPEYGLVMPFVVCQSNGGPFDDLAYVAGWEMGAFDAEVSLMETTQPWRPAMPIRRDNIAQADLVAMRYGWSASFEDTEVDEWVSVELRPAEDRSPQ